MEEEDHQLALDVIVENQVHKLVGTMNESLRDFNSALENKEPFTIYRVLPSVRKGHEEDYDPKIISIGPFHHKKMIPTPMKQLKWRYLHDLLNRSHEQNLLEKYIRNVTQTETRIRKKYGEEVVELDSNSFVQMMVLDGCFIIELLIKWYIGDERLSQLLDVNWNLPLLRNDLLLLENQIPFFILHSLFEQSHFSNLPDLDLENTVDIPVTLMKLAVYFINHDKIKSDLIKKDPGTIHHLLHLFHMSLDPASNHEKSSTRSFGQKVTHIMKKPWHSISWIFVWLLSSFLYCRMLNCGSFKCWGGHKNPTDDETPRAPRMLPNATQLKDCGVKFRKKDKRKSLLDLDVSFRDGVMKIPMLAIQDGTRSQFRNLIAFEQCCHQSGCHFTSYATLLNNLIDTKEDVAILKGRGIIESKLGHDEEVADLFNKLCDGAYLSFEKHYLVGLFKDVKQYSDVSGHRWRARLMHDYFGNPWTIISLIAAIVLLILTFLQTFFAVYAYYRPPN